MILFPSDGNVEHEMKSRIGAASALMRASYQAVGVKRELSNSKASNLAVNLCCNPHLSSALTGDRKNVAKMSFLCRAAELSFTDNLREEQLLHMEVMSASVVITMETYL